MTNEIDWDNAPEGAEYFNSYHGNFYKVEGCMAMFFDAQAEIWCSSMSFSVDELKEDKHTTKRPQPKLKYEYGVEHPTNGQKPDLPDDVVVKVSVKFQNGYTGDFEVGERNNWCFTESFRIVDERYKPVETAQEASKPQSPYQRTIIGFDGSKCVVDVYRLLDAFEVDSHAIAHAIKKLLAPGKRHAKTREQDLKEAIKSIESELLLMEQRK